VGEIARPAKATANAKTRMAIKFSLRDPVIFRWAPTLLPLNRNNNEPAVNHRLVCSTADKLPLSTKECNAMPQIFYGTGQFPNERTNGFHLLLVNLGDILCRQVTASLWNSY
jgi:hypothetical protein